MVHYVKVSTAMASVKTPTSKSAIISARILSGKVMDLLLGIRKQPSESCADTNTKYWGNRGNTINKLALCAAACVGAQNRPCAQVSEHYRISDAMFRTTSKRALVRCRQLLLTYKNVIMLHTAILPQPYCHTDMERILTL